MHPKVNYFFIYTDLYSECVSVRACNFVKVGHVNIMTLVRDIKTLLQEIKVSEQFYV